MKIRPVGAELFHTDGQTDITKLIIAFSNFANAPKNCIFPHIVVSSYLTVNPPPFQYINRLLSAMC